MNTAMGIATSVTHYMSLFANSIVQPMQPQITKSFASGNKNRTDELLVMSTKYSFLLTLLVGSIFLIAPEWILKLWLGEVPPYTIIFLVLFIIDQLIQSFNSGISNIIWASGKIALYQMLTSMLNIIAVVVGYMVLHGGAAAYYLVVTYIVFSVIRFFAIQWSLHRTLHYDNAILWKYSYIPSLIVVVLYAPMIFILSGCHPLVRIIVSLLYIFLLIWLVGLTNKERRQLLNLVKKNGVFNSSSKSQ